MPSNCPGRARTGREIRSPNAWSKRDRPCVARPRIVPGEGVARISMAPEVAQPLHPRQGFVLVVVKRVAGLAVSSCDFHMSLRYRILTAYQYWLVVSGPPKILVNQRKR